MVVDHSTNLHVRSRSKLNMAFMVPGPTAEATLDGRAIRPDQLLVGEPGAEGGLQTSNPDHAPLI